MEEMTVSLRRIEKILEGLHREKVQDVSFSFIIGSLFPEAYEGIKKLLIEERIKGYQEAREEYKQQIERIFNEDY